MKATPWLATAVILGSAAFACQIVAGIERVQKAEPRPGSDGAAPLDPCKHAVAPELPPVDDDREKVEPPFYLAFRSMRIVDGATGLDLDGVCTCFSGGDTAFDAGSTCKPRVQGTDCDGDGGIDNKFGELYVSMGPLLGASPDGTLGDNPIRRGFGTVLLAVIGWNGLPNDRDVDVGLLVSNGIYDPGGCNSPDAGSSQFPPQWCGRDRWSRPRGSTSPQAGAILPTVTAKAWVSGGVLSYRQQISVALTFDRIPLTISAPVIAGRLERNERGLRQIRGVMSGRLNANDALRSIGQVNQGINEESGAPENGEPLCKQASFAALRSLVCDAVDISSTESFDRTPGDCDAMSLAIEFVAEEAALGDERDDLPLQRLCEDVEPALLRCPE